MREIKFRGKRIANGKWVYGSLLLWPDGCCTILESKDGCNYVWKRDIDPETVGQYTGLKDRNGKEIYEGDTVGYRFTDSSSTTGKVVWWGARCGFYIRTRENDYYELTEHCQVIDASPTTRG